MFRISAILICTVLTGCQIVPSEGPSTKSINSEAGQSAAELGRRNAAVFDIVDVDNRSANLISSYVSTALNRRFGIGGHPGAAVIGIGDELRITIFEAGSDGLFSTATSKQTSLDIVVQPPSGTASIPYAGTVKFAGKTFEQARKTILDALATKAIEPDVIINGVSNSSRNVTVSGAVGHSSEIPLSLTGDKITEVIAKAGGPTSQPYETYVTLVRGQKTGTALLKSVIENPSENVYVQPGDQVFVSRDPRTFTVLGAVKSESRVGFGASDLNLLEAVALGGGGDDASANAKGYFLFRYEEADIVSALLGPQRFQELLRKGMTHDRAGRYPIVYRFDMTHADNLIVGQTFPIKNRDVIYASRHPAVDFTKFLTIVGTPLGFVSRGAAIATEVNSVNE